MSPFDQTDLVSRNRPRPRDHHQKVKPSKPKGIAFITTEVDEASGAALVSCSCGMSKFHKRRKVAEDWAERHVAKKHKGRAVWQEA